MSSGRPRQRLFVDEPLAPGCRLELSRGQVHYLVRVMRRRDGDTVLVFNGRDGEWRGDIAVERRGRDCTVTVVEQTRRQTAEPDLWLLFAPVKRAALDFLVTKATELGVAMLQPVNTGRTVVERVNLERLRANAIEAAEQCRRLSVPVCRPPARLEAVLADWPGERRLLFCDESGAGTPIARALEGAGREQPGPWAVITGPEGGFSADETAALAAVPHGVRVSLGPRVLRAETAAIAALACWQALAGDGR